MVPIAPSWLQIALLLPRGGQKNWRFGIGTSIACKTFTLVRVDQLTPRSFVDDFEVGFPQKHPKSDYVCSSHQLFEDL